MPDETRRGAGPAVPWTGPELLLALLAALVLWPQLAYQLLLAGGFFRTFYGPEAVAATEAGPARQLMLSRMGLWSGALAFPFQAATFPLLFAALSGTRPDQLGLTRRRLGRNLLLGAAVALLLVPAVLGLNVLAVDLYQH